MLTQRNRISNKLARTTANNIPLQNTKKRAISHYFEDEPLH